MCMLWHRACPASEYGKTPPLHLDLGNDLPLLGIPKLLQHTHIHTHTYTHTRARAHTHKHRDVVRSQFIWSPMICLCLTTLPLRFPNPPNNRTEGEEAEATFTHTNFTVTCSNILITNSKTPLTVVAMSTIAMVIVQGCIPVCCTKVKEYLTACVEQSCLRGHDWCGVKECINKEDKQQQHTPQHNQK